MEQLCVHWKLRYPLTLSSLDGMYFNKKNLKIKNFKYFGLWITWMSFKCVGVAMLI